MIQIDKNDLEEIVLDLDGIINLLTVVEGSEFYERQDAGVFHAIGNSVEHTRDKLRELLANKNESEESETYYKIRFTDTENPDLAWLGRRRIEHVLQFFETGETMPFVCAIEKNMLEHEEILEYLEGRQYELVETMPKSSMLMKVISDRESLIIG